MTYSLYQTIVYCWMAIGVATFILLLKITAPYGRHTSAKWGPQISNRSGWMIMELPVMLMLMYFVLTNIEYQNAVTWLLIAAFMFHYINRTFIFPLRIRTAGKKMPLVIVLSAVFFNLVNGFSLGYYFAHFANYDNSWFKSIPFVSGLILFITGVVINWKADSLLISLRKPGETGYVIPNRWLFSYISCPNLFGEIIEWSGYALMCWNLPAVSFLVWTCANLIPRAISHHQWYKEKFEDYPKDRKAVIPFIL